MPSPPVKGAEPIKQMNLMCQLLTLALLLAVGPFCVSSYGQGSQRQATALGNVNSQARILAYAQIKVCSYNSSTPTACTSTVTIYKDPALTIPYPSNPFQADKNGNYSYWVTAGNYVEQMCATGATCQTQVITLGGSGGSANIPHATQVLSGDGAGNAIAMPEKGTTPANGVASVAWDEDVVNGRFDCRNPAYAGGCLGSTPGAAMQMFRDQLICYQATTGKHARTALPPGGIPVGTDAFPTLTLPVGVAYEGVGGWGFATMATQFQATYNNHIAVDFENGLTPSSGCIDTLTSVANVSGGGTTTYTGTIAGGASNGLAGRTFTIAGFTNSLNNGAFTVTASTATTLTLQNGTGTAETHAATAAPTSGVAGGSYDGFAEHGCGQGGCRNAPGDSGNYPFGGPSQQGILINDADGTIGAKAGVYANNNGADGVLCNGTDSHCHIVGGAANNTYFYFGMETAGQNYQPSAGECHADVVLGGLDNMNEGPFEVYGTFMTLGWEYGHVAGICWAGGLTNIGHVFSQIEEIGIIHMAGGNDQASADSVRIDAPRGEGILEQSNGLTTWDNPRIISACRFAGAADYLVSTVTTATPGTGQTPGTYILTGSDGTTQISVTVGSGGAVTTSPTVRVHGRGMTNTPPTYTLAAGGTPATFTVNMLPVFELLHLGGGVPFTACSYILDQSGGSNTYLSPLMVNNGFFGADHSTGDVVTPNNANTWVAATGNSPNKDIIWDPNPAALGAFFPGNAQRIIRADPASGFGGFAITGSVIDVGFDGTHIQMANTSPVTLTAITGVTIAEELWITGDGFTTMPFSNNVAFFGAATNTAHNLLLVAGQLYHFVVTAGMASGNPVHLTEQSDSIFSDYIQPGFNELASNGALPATTTQATLDAAGSIAVRPYPAMADPTITTAGTGSGFTYCIVVEVWAGGGKQTSHSVCNSHTPPVTSTSVDNFQVHQALPQNWTRYQVRLNSTTDPAFTPGVWYDTTTANGLPQLAQCDFSLVFGCVTGGDGVFITKRVPTDTSVIATANIGLNMTGTYNMDRTNIPVSTTTLGSPGQTQFDPINGILWYATSEDTWASWTLGGGGGGGGLVYTAPTVNAIPMVSSAGGSGTVVNSHFSDDGTNTYDSENFQLTGTDSIEPTGNATSGANFPSNAIQLLTSYFTDGTAVKTNWNIQVSIGTGTLPATTLNFFSPPESPTDAFFIGINPSQSATSGANLNSPKFQLGGATWNGSTSLPDTWQQQVVEGTGSNPTSTLTITHTGSSGTALVDIPGLKVEGIPEIESATASNSDISGELAFSAATTASYSWANTYASHPECALEPQFSTTVAHWVTYTSTTSFTINFASAVTGSVSYVCIGRN